LVTIIITQWLQNMCDSDSSRFVLFRPYIWGWKSIYFTFVTFRNQILESILIIKTSCLMLFRDIIAIDSVRHDKHINTLKEQNAT
jgi:hypothetical protein